MNFSDCSLYSCAQTIRCKQKIRSFAMAPSQAAKGGVSLTIALVNNSLEVGIPGFQAFNASQWVNMLRLTMFVSLCHACQLLLCLTLRCSAKQTPLALQQNPLLSPVNTAGMAHQRRRSKPPAWFRLPRSPLRHQDSRTVKR